MKQITEIQINKVIAELDKEFKNPFDQMFETIAEEQDEICDYLYEVEDDEFNDDERDILYSTAVTGWYIIKKIIGCDDSVSGDFLDVQLDRNLDLFKNKIYDSQPEGDTLRNVFGEYNEQGVLMDFLISLIVEQPDDYQGTIREEMVPTMILHVKTVVDCLILDEAEWGETLEFEGEYSKTDFDIVRSMIETSLKKYKKSSLFMELNHGEKEEAEFVIRSFSEMMYNYFLLMPVDWDVRHTVECCIDIMPRKVMAGDEFFKCIVPVLTSFLLFMNKTDEIPEAKKIAEHIEKIEDLILKSAQNPDNWGPGKSMLIGAQKSGVNLEDENEITEYLKSQEKGTGELLSFPSRNQKVGRNNPCPCGSGEKYKKCCGKNE